jgi:hypothetical protein
MRAPAVEDVKATEGARTNLEISKALSTMNNVVIEPLKDGRSGLVKTLATMNAAGILDRAGRLSGVLATSGRSEVCA